MLGFTVHIDFFYQLFAESTIAKPISNDDNYWQAK